MKVLHIVSVLYVLLTCCFPLPFIIASSVKTCMLLVWTIGVGPVQPWLLAWILGFTLHTAGWFIFLRQALSRPLPHSEISIASFFPRK